MQELLTLTQAEFTLLAVICFCAGLVRGFTGFALSAIVMASAALILSPLAL
ncbi:MAG: sulfite exporter TauE/SafE family protein, partial [Rhodobacteraceae bacterium]|nr:sulfite exporter TauE/SafE family protein [Paracoccaceae bacterium]